MKLAVRYQRINLLITLIIFLLASAAFYALLHHVLILQIDEETEVEQHEIQTYINRFDALPPNIVAVEDQIVRYEKVAAPLAKSIRRTVVLEDEIEHETGDFRQLVFTVRAGGQWYRVSVSKSLEATAHLADSIGLIALGTIALMLLITFLINRIVLRRLWKPFYTTIHQLRDFKIDGPAKLLLAPTSTDEFALLNTTLEAATSKASKDYQVLKEFTENASHELQTPLAIVRSKLDLLIQDEALSEPQSHLIQDAYAAIRRMSHLNQSLLLLAKIENGQYGDQEEISLEKLLSEKLSLFDTLITDKKLTVSLSLQPVILFINPDLADMLLNNLISNAIHHNHRGGFIDVKLNEHSLTICNTAAGKELAPAGLFNRFYKTTSGATRTGLGLAIAKQVCDVSGFAINYRYEDGNRHCFSVHWKTP